LVCKDLAGEGVVVEVAWVGVDVGKAHHWVVAADPQGRVVLSRKVANDQQQIARVVAEVGKLAGRLVWTVDLTTAEAALLLAVLLGGGQTVRYLSGRAVNQAAASYRGEGKTDARDAHVIADQARMRRDLPRLGPGEDLVAELRLLVAQRADLVGDRTRTLNRLRQHLTGVCPALERVAEPASQGGWLVLLARYQRPAAIRRAGVRRLSGLLAAQGMRAATAQHLAETAVAAARTQSLRLAGEEVAAELVATLAQQATDLGYGSPPSTGRSPAALAATGWPR
jgi:Transposase